MGRDPATLEVTGLVALNYPELGEPYPFTSHFLSGSTEEIAIAIQEYEQMGVSQLMFHCDPYNTAALARLAEAMQMYRKMGTGNTRQGR